MSQWITRAAGAASRRLGRPELLAVLDATARRDQQEMFAIRVVLASVLKTESTYVDVGANRGQILANAVRLAPEGNHVAFEPIPSLARGVQEKWPQVDCRAVALGASPGYADYCHFRTLDAWSGLQRRPEISPQQGHPETIRVKVSTLDEEIGDTTPTALKVDVEGGEFDVLLGAARVLADVRPVVLFEHERRSSLLYGAPPDEPWAFLRGLGYRVFTVTGRGPVSRGEFSRAHDVVNWLATPA